MCTAMSTVTVIQNRSVRRCFFPRTVAEVHHVFRVYFRSGFKLPMIIYILSKYRGVYCTFRSVFDYGPAVWNTTYTWVISPVPAHFPFFLFLVRYVNGLSHFIHLHLFRTYESDSDPVNHRVHLEKITVRLVKFPSFKRSKVLLLWRRLSFGMRRVVW